MVFPGTVSTLVRIMDDSFEGTGRTNPRLRGVIVPQHGRPLPPEPPSLKDAVHHSQRSELPGGSRLLVAHWPRARSPHRAGHRHRGRWSGLAPAIAVSPRVFSS